jgi:hypothetical protein
MSIWVGAERLGLEERRQKGSKVVTWIRIAVRLVGEQPLAKRSRILRAL